MVHHLDAKTDGLVNAQLLGGRFELQRGFPTAVGHMNRRISTDGCRFVVTLASVVKEDFCVFDSDKVNGRKWQVSANKTMSTFRIQRT